MEFQFVRLKPQIVYEQGLDFPIRVCTFQMQENVHLFQGDILLKFFFPKVLTQDDRGLLFPSLPE